MKKIILILAVVSINACGSGPKEAKKLTPEEQVAAALTKYFEAKALDCSVASVHCIDTLYEAMPEDDPVFSRYLKEHDDREKKRQLRRLHGPVDPMDRTYLDSAIIYRRNYKGPVESYLYKCVVRSESYELKKDVEGVLYLIDTSRAQVMRAVESDYLEVLENMRYIDDMLLYD